MNKELTLRDFVLRGGVPCPHLRPSRSQPKPPARVVGCSHSEQRTLQCRGRLSVWVRRSFPTSCCTPSASRAPSHGLGAETLQARSISCRLCTPVRITCSPSTWTLNG